MKKQKNILISFLLLFISCTAFSQTITFEKYYPGYGAMYGACGQQTFDHGYIVTGMAYSSTSAQDVILMKTDSIGQILWTKIYGGSNTDAGAYIEQTTDSGFIVVGLKDAINVNDSKTWLLKTDKNGDTLWTKTISRGVGANEPFCVRQTSDGGYVITGQTTVNSHGSYDVMLIKTNSNGDTLWTKAIGGSAVDAGYCVEQTANGEYIISGNTFSYGLGNYDVYLIRTNPVGDTLWTKTFGGPRLDISNSVQETSDAGFIITGSTQSFHDTIDDDIYLIKCNSIGDTLWTKTYGGNYATEQTGACVQQTSDGGFIITGNNGQFNGDVYLIKTNSIGDSSWAQHFGEGADGAWFVRQTADGGYIVTGESHSYAPSAIYLLKTDSVGFAITGIGNHDRPLTEIFVYPNPFISSTTFIIPENIFRKENATIKIYDQLGRLSTEIPANNSHVILERNGMQSGLYYFQIVGNDKIFVSGKIIIED